MSSMTETHKDPDLRSGVAVKREGEEATEGENAQLRTLQTLQSATPSFLGAEKEGRVADKVASDEPCSTSPLPAEVEKKEIASVMFADRKVVLDSDRQHSDTTSLYSACRRWFKNDPQGTEPSTCEKENANEELVKLPAPLPKVRRDMASAKPDGDPKAAAGSSRDAIWNQHIGRWKAVKKQRVKEIHADAERFEERMKALFSPQ